MKYEIPKDRKDRNDSITYLEKREKGIKEDDILCRICLYVSFVFSLISVVVLGLGETFPLTVFCFIATLLWCVSAFFKADQAKRREKLIEEIIE